MVVLGATGRNFGAGMSGGVAYVYDVDGKLHQRINPELVKEEDLTGAVDEAVLFELLNQHFQVTESGLAAQILDDWETLKRRFVKVAPKSMEQRPASPEVKIDNVQIQQQVPLTAEAVQGGYHG